MRCERTDGAEVAAAEAEFEREAPIPDEPPIAELIEAEADDAPPMTTADEAEVKEAPRPVEEADALNIRQSFRSSQLHVYNSETHD